MIPLSIPNLSGNEWKYIKSCLDTNWVSTAGSFVNRFEESMRNYTGAKYAVSCVNGTAALHVALLVAGVKAGDEVIVPTLTFIAPVNTVKYIGADPIFMDCDKYFNLDVEKTLDFLTKETIKKDGYLFNKISGKKISGIIPVHVFGNPVNLEPLLDVCKQWNIKIIEDATESLGSYYSSGNLKSKYTGTVGDFGCYSFNGNKIITTGGGGMLVTSNPEFAKKAKYLTTQAKDDELKYVHNEVGFNYRLTNIQAAMGVAQLEQLEGFIKTKKDNYCYYRDRLADIAGLHLQGVPEYAASNYWFYAVEIENAVFLMSRDRLMNHLSKTGIQTRPVWYLNHRQKPFKNYRAYKIELAVKKWEQTLNFPCSTNLKTSDIDTIINCLRKVK